MQAHHPISALASMPPLVALASAAAPGHVVAAASPSARTAPLAVSLPMIKVNASVLKSIQGFGDMDDMLYKDKVLRRMGQGQVDIDEDDASDKIAVVDAVVAVLGMSDAGARQWINNSKNMNKDIAPSLAYVKSKYVRLLNTIYYVVTVRIYLFAQSHLCEYIYSRNPTCANISIRATPNN